MYPVNRAVSRTFFFLFQVGALLFGAMGCADSISSEVVAVGESTPSIAVDGAEQSSDTLESGGESDSSPSSSTSVDGESAEETPDGQECKEGEACEDGNPCTIEDRCSNGQCAGMPVICDDGLSCTVDVCGQSGECSHSLSPGFCLVEGECHGEGAASPDNPCLGCEPLIATDGFSPRSGGPCDDGNPCTEGDACLSGKCADGQPVVCDDGNACTADACEADEGCTHLPVVAPCDDGDFCTVGDECLNGECTPGGALFNCDDGNPCTEDSCSDGGCSAVALEGPCDDGNLCTEGDTCFDGSCQPGAPAALGCDDANPCTDQGCDPEFGCIYLPNLLPCDDGDPCSLDDLCEKGLCLAGGGIPNCDDSNPCTTESCVVNTGCVAFNTLGPCDDGEVCTTVDVCEEGVCVGTTVANCDDGNACTDDSCESGIGCTSVANTSPCDDGALCTELDTCSAGECVGSPIVCDDGNACTMDSCDGESGVCVFKPENSLACLPFVTITSPTRGEGILGDTNGVFVVEGTYGSPAGEPFLLLLEHSGANGILKTVELLSSGDASDGEFQLTIQPEHGKNHVSVTIEDTLGVVRSRSHGFFHTTEWIPPGDLGFKQDGLVILLGPDVIDDGDRSLPANDLGTVFELVAQGIDLSAVLQPGQKIATQNVAILGDVDIFVDGFTYAGPYVSLTSKDGALGVVVTLSNLDVDLRFQYQICFFGCSTQTLTGNATASSVTVETDIVLALNPTTGELEASAASTNATVSSNFDVSIDGALGGLVGFIVGFFNDTFAEELANVLEQEVGALIPPLFGEAFGSLELSEVFSFPALLGGDTVVEILFESFLQNMEFFVEGARIGMETTANALAEQSTSALGSFGRANCLSPGVEVPPFFAGSDLGIGLHDDVFNRLLFAVWKGGGLEFPLDPSLLSGFDLQGLGISGLEVGIEFTAPPVVTGCNPEGVLQIQVADMAVYTDLNFGLTPLAVDIYVSFVGEAEFAVVSGPTGQQLGLTIANIGETLLDLEFADPTQASFAGPLSSLIEAELIPTFLDTLTEGEIGGFPLPAIDLSGVEGVPEGVALELDLQSIDRVGGYSVLEGGVK